MICFKRRLDLYWFQLEYLSSSIALVDVQLFGIANIGLDDNMLVCFTVQFSLFSRKVSLYFDSRIYEQQYIDVR